MRHSKARGSRRRPPRSSRRRTLRALVATLAAVAGCTDAGTSLDDPEVRVFVDEVVVDERATPVVLLQEETGDRVLPIWIGTSEARSIAHELARVEPQRPNTHDTATNLVALLGGRVERLVVNALEGGTYYGLLTVVRDDEPVVIDVRPSDGIAMALRAGAPLFVRESVLRAAAETPAEGEENRAPERRKPTGIDPATPGRSV